MLLTEYNEAEVMELVKEDGSAKEAKKKERNLFLLLKRRINN